MVDGSNNVVARYVYDAFGNCTVIGTTQNQPIASNHLICGNHVITGGNQGINTDPNFIGNINPLKYLLRSHKNKQKYNKTRQKQNKNDQNDGFQQKLSFFYFEFK